MKIMIFIIFLLFYSNILAFNFSAIRNIQQRCLRNLTASSKEGEIITKILKIPKTNKIIIVNQKKIIIKNKDTGDYFKIFQDSHEQNIMQVIYSPFNDIIVTVSKDGTIRGWKLDAATLLSSFTIFHSIDKVGINCVVNMPNTEIMITGHMDNSISVWNITAALYYFEVYGPFAAGVHIKTLNQSFSLTDQILTISHFCCDKEPYNQQIITGSEKGTLQVVDFKQEIILRKFEEFCSKITHLSVINDTDLILIGCDDKKIRIFDVILIREMHSFIGHTNQLTALHQVLYDTDYIVSAGFDGARVWNMKTKKQTNIITIYKGVVDLQLDLDDKELMVTNEGNFLSFHSHLNQDQVKSFFETLNSGHSNKVTVAIFANLNNQVQKSIQSIDFNLTQEELILSGSEDNTLRVLVGPLYNQEYIKIYQNHTGPILNIVCLICDNSINNITQSQIKTYHLASSAFNESYILLWNLDVPNTYVGKINTTIFLQNSSSYFNETIIKMEFIAETRELIVGGTSGIIRSFTLPIIQDFNITKQYFQYTHNLPITELVLKKIPNNFEYYDLLNRTQQQQYNSFYFLLISASQDKTLKLFNFTSKYIIKNIFFPNSDNNVYINTLDILPLRINQYLNTIINIVIGFNFLANIQIIRIDMKTKQYVQMDTNPKSEVIHKLGILYVKTLEKNQQLQLIASAADYQMVVWNISFYINESTWETNFTKIEAQEIFQNVIAYKIDISQIQNKILLSAQEGVNIWQKDFYCSCNYTTLQFNCNETCNYPYKSIIFNDNLVKCIENCPSSTYSSEYNCLQCHSNCLQCKGPNLEDCLICKYNKDNETNFCLPKDSNIQIAGLQTFKFNYEKQYQSLILAYILVGASGLLIIILIGTLIYKKFGKSNSKSIRRKI